MTQFKNDDVVWCWSLSERWRKGFISDAGHKGEGWYDVTYDDDLVHYESLPADRIQKTAPPDKAQPPRRRT